MDSVALATSSDSLAINGRLNDQRPFLSAMRRSKSIETLLPIFYLKGISTGDFSEALAALSARMLPGCRHPPSAA